MIALLQTIAAARDQAPQILGRPPRGPSRMAARDRPAGRILPEPAGRRRHPPPPPYADPQPIALDHALADELRALEAGDRDLPIVQVGQALALLERPAPIRLEGPDLCTSPRSPRNSTRCAVTCWTAATLSPVGRRRSRPHFRRSLRAVRRALDHRRPHPGRGERPAGQAAALGDRPGKKPSGRK